MLTKKSCPLFKSTLPVYFVGILSSLVDIEIDGWFNLNLDISNQSICSYKSQIKTESSPSSFKNLKIINSSKYSNNCKSKNSKEIENNQSEDENKTSLDKRIDYMNNYLKNLFFTISLNQTNLDGLISIFEMMK